MGETKFYYFPIKEYNGNNIMKGDAVMSFSRKPKKTVQEVDTNVWACTNEDCAGWMRESYSFNEVPECPLCQSPMNKEVRVLPELDNS